VLAGLAEALLTLGKAQQQHWLRQRTDLGCCATQLLPAMPSTLLGYCPANASAPVPSEASERTKPWSWPALLSSQRRASERTKPMLAPGGDLPEIHLTKRSERTNKVRPDAAQTVSLASERTKHGVASRCVGATAPTGQVLGKPHDIGQLRSRHCETQKRILVISIAKTAEGTPTPPRYCDPFEPLSLSASVHARPQDGRARLRCLP
jgi:hypothetical protein